MLFSYMQLIFDFKSLFVANFHFNWLLGLFLSFCLINLKSACPFLILVGFATVRFHFMLFMALPECNVSETVKLIIAESG